MYMKKPKAAATIAEYCDKELQPYVTNLAAMFKAKTIAIAWDLYFDDSIKLARESRGEGCRQHDLPRKGNYRHFIVDSLEYEFRK